MKNLAARGRGRVNIGPTQNEKNQKRLENEISKNAKFLNEYLGLFDIQSMKNEGESSLIFKLKIDDVLDVVKETALYGLKIILTKNHDTQLLEFVSINSSEKHELKLKTNLNIDEFNQNFPLSYVIDIPYRSIISKLFISSCFENDMSYQQKTYEAFKAFTNDKAFVTPEFKEDSQLRLVLNIFQINLAEDIDSESIKFELREKFLHFCDVVNCYLCSKINTDFNEKHSNLLNDYKNLFNDYCYDDCVKSKLLSVFEHKSQYFDLIVLFEFNYIQIQIAADYKDLGIKYLTIINYDQLSQLYNVCKENLNNYENEKMLNSSTNQSSGTVIEFISNEKPISEKKLFVIQYLEQFNISLIHNDGKTSAHFALKTESAPIVKDALFKGLEIILTKNYEFDLTADIRGNKLMFNQDFASNGEDLLNDIVDECFDEKLPYSALISITFVDSCIIDKDLNSNHNYVHFKKYAEKLVTQNIIDQTSKLFVIFNAFDIEQEGKFSHINPNNMKFNSMMEISEFLKVQTTENFKDKHSKILNKLSIFFKSYNCKNLLEDELISIFDKKTMYFGATLNPDKNYIISQIIDKTLAIKYFTILKYDTLCKFYHEMIVEYNKTLMYQYLDQFSINVNDCGNDECELTFTFLQTNVDDRVKGLLFKGLEIVLRGNANFDVSLNTPTVAQTYVIKIPSSYIVSGDINEDIVNFSYNEYVSYKYSLEHIFLDACYKYNQNNQIELNNKLINDFVSYIKNICKNPNFDKEDTLYDIFYLFPKLLKRINVRDKCNLIATWDETAKRNIKTSIEKETAHQEFMDLKHLINKLLSFLRNESSEINTKSELLKIFNNSLGFNEEEYNHKTLVDKLENDLNATNETELTAEYTNISQQLKEYVIKYLTDEVETSSSQQAQEPNNIPEPKPNVVPNKRLEGFDKQYEIFDKFLKVLESSHVPSDTKLGLVNVFNNSLDRDSAKLSQDELIYNLKNNLISPVELNFDMLEMLEVALDLWIPTLMVSNKVEKELDKKLPEQQAQEPNNIPEPKPNVVPNKRLEGFDKQYEIFDKFLKVLESSHVPSDTKLGLINVFNNFLDRDSAKLSQDELIYNLKNNLISPVELNFDMLEMLEVALNLWIPAPMTSRKDLYKRLEGFDRHYDVFDRCLKVLKNPNLEKYKPALVKKFYPNVPRDCLGTMQTLLIFMLERNSVSPSEFGNASLLQLEKQLNSITLAHKMSTPTYTRQVPTTANPGGVDAINRPIINSQGNNRANNPVPPNNNSLANRLLNSYLSLPVMSTLIAHEIYMQYKLSDTPKSLPQLFITFGLVASSIIFYGNHEHRNIKVIGILEKCIFIGAIIVSTYIDPKATIVEVLLAGTATFAIDTYRNSNSR